VKEARKKSSDKFIKAVRENGKKGGRPEVSIDWGEFEKLCQMHCTLEELAGWFGCHANTIEVAVKREHGIGFREYLGQKAGVGKVSLRRAQWQKALAGDKTMLIWMGKQHLGQLDKSRFDLKHDVSELKATVVFESNGHEPEK